MPLSPAFTVTTYSLNLSVITITDTSTGSDPSIVGRRIYFTNANGDYVVPSGTLTNYVDWDLVDLSINVDIIKVAIAFNIRVDWVDNLGAVLYTTNDEFAFVDYFEWFLYGLTQTQQANPPIIQDTNYYMNKIRLRVETDNATNAAMIAGDISNAQSSINRGQFMIDRQNEFF